MIIKNNIEVLPENCMPKICATSRIILRLKIVLAYCQSIWQLTSLLKTFNTKSLISLERVV